MKTPLWRATAVPPLVASLLASFSFAAFATVVDREAFEQLAPVSEALRHLHYFDGMRMAPAPQEPSAEERCWQAVLPDARP